MSEPQSARAPEIDLLVEFLKTAVGVGATYVSTPITTGPRFVEWVRSRGPGPGGAADRAFRDEVVAPNCARAEPFVRRLREAGRTVIDPTRFHPGEWSQGDFRYLWSRVISSCASECVFLDGWPLSNGCAYEFLTARRRGLPTFDERWGPLGSGEGIEALARAVALLRENRVPTEFPEWVIAELRRLESRS